MYIFQKACNITLCLIVFALFGSCQTQTHNDIIDMSVNKTYIHPLQEMPTGFLAGHRYEITNMSAIAVMNQIYESLFIYDGNADIKPLLIERWNVSDNGKKYTFFLKQRVLFHNYNEMTSRDVVYSLKEVAQESSRLIQLPIQDLNSSIIECGRYCVEINFIKPCQKLLSVLTGSVFKIFPDGSLGENNVPPGTGPFMITKMGDDFIKAARFDRYREKTKSNIDTVFFKHMIKEDALGAFTENGVDDLFEYVLTEQEARSLRGVIVSRPTFIINYIGLNSKLYPFNNIEVRKAVQHAINKDYLFDKHFSQHMRLNGLIPKGIVGGARNEKYFDYSPDLSRALLKKAKVKTPLKVEFWVRRQDWNEGFINDIADQLAQIGIHIVIKHEDDKSFYATYFSRQQPIFLIPLSGVYPEASNYLGVFRSDSTDNDVLLADKKIDSSLEELSDMSDRNKLENAVYNIEDRILQSAAIIPLYQRRAISVYQPWLVGVDMSFLWYNNFKINNYVKKSEKRS